MFLYMLTVERQAGLHWRWCGFGLDARQSDAESTDRTGSIVTHPATGAGSEPPFPGLPGWTEALGPPQERVWSLSLSRSSWCRCSPDC